MSGRAKAGRTAIRHIDDQIAALMARRDEALKKQREEIGRLCERAGLLEISAAPEVLEVALREVAKRFQKHPNAAGHSQQPVDPDASGAAPNVE